ncbi:hypothetical protein ACFPYI_17870 [Halomarina salina]|uniref:Uncharacterized protein n=1 Tax=Halomarina salina TaxID=1872699 RepID=A0ABD5RSH8_9EURY|nr:hypothetical protein [Halomarina salina]
MDFSRGGRSRIVVGVVCIVSLLGSAVVAQNSLLTTVGSQVNLGDLGGLVFVAWVTLLLLVTIGRVADVEPEENE